jgi:hypothetical protein
MNVFIQDRENELVKHCLFIEKRLFGLKSLELLRLVFEFAMRSNNFHPLKDTMLEKCWYQEFIKWHPHLRLRAPEKTPL